MGRKPPITKRHDVTKNGEGQSIFSLKLKQGTHPTNCVTALSDLSSLKGFISQNVWMCQTVPPK